MQPVAAKPGKKISPLLIGQVSTRIAEPVDNYMFEIGRKTESFDKGLLDGIEKVFRTLNRLPAFRADQVMMVALFGMVVDEPVVGFALVDGSGLFEGIECTVDGGLVHSGHSLADNLEYLLGGDVFVSVVDDIHDQSSLRSELQSLAFQGLKATHSNCTWLQLYKCIRPSVNRAHNIEEKGNP
jgi:hypothetical protein